ncbi:MAG: DNA recombination/repair protein RecA, partial [Anaerovorax sp.]
EVTTGGRALKFYSTMRIDVRRIESIKSGDSIMGNRTRAKIVKNKVAPPFKQAEFDIMYGKGISREGDVLDCAVEAKLVEKAGAWYSFDGNRIGQGRDNVKNYLKENKEVMAKMEEALKASLIVPKPSDDDPEESLPPDDAMVDELLKVDEDGVIIE